MVGQRKRKRASTLKPSQNPNQQKDNEETLSSGNGEISGYEKCRDQRIKENMQRMQKLGILDLSLKLQPPKSSSTRNASHKTNPKSPPLLPPSEPPRRSSRLKNATPISYSEIRNKKSETSKNDEIYIREGSKPEIYTEEHDKLLGDCKTSWTLLADGYDKNGKRIYDQVKGETCHQCRQKTLGLHTHCSKCDLVQGQFCGDCLYMRYGENVIEANQNSSWICPVCRGICNCSLCRNAKGWTPTGNLYRKVSNLGFKSVAHYLIQTRRSQPIAEDIGTEPISANELLLIADTGSQTSLDDEFLDEDKGHEGSPKPQLHGNIDDGMEEEEEEVRCLENKHIDGFPKRQPEDIKDDGMEEKEKVHDLERIHVHITGAYSKDEDDAVDNVDELKEEKEGKGNRGLNNSKLEIGSKLYVEPAVTSTPAPNSLLED
ncbi:hypothetical protein L1049_014758 [Liquidambar formosana]|uniref:Zinc-finger domain-containing protein n=1 Tax=Liquidambar formosana TaxID=63359 RepID=A0AAP0RXQ0_LIQFO